MRPNWPTTIKFNTEVMQLARGGKLSSGKKQTPAELVIPQGLEDSEPPRVKPFMAVVPGAKKV